MGGKRRKLEPKVDRPNERRAVYGHNASVIRKSRKLNQAQVAERAGLSRGAYSAFENGVSNTRLLNIMAMADALGVSVSLILSESEIQLNSSQ